MALCTVEDIQTRLGQPLEGDEALRVQAFIEDVTGLIVAYCRGYEIPDPPPADIKAAAVSEVLRALNGNPGIIAEEIGEISTRYSVYRFGLSADARYVLRRYRSNRFASVSAAGGGRAV